jgi:hypothetical protein
MRIAPDRMRSDRRAAAGRRGRAVVATVLADIMLRRCVRAMAVIAAAAVIPQRAHAPSVAAADVVYRRDAASAVNRSLAQVLGTQVSVLDFGAVGDCFGSTEATCPHDATAAFQAALQLVPGGPLENRQTVHVPRGNYRIDGTLQVACALILDFGATLHRIRVNTTDHNTAPLVSLFSAGALLRGGALRTDLPSPQGVVSIGPTGGGADYPVEFTLLEGVHITGGGQSQPRRPDGSLLPPQLQLLDSIGVRMHGVDTYQNWVRGLVVSDVDIGIQLGHDTNANQLTDNMLLGIGKWAYHLVNCSESTITGGFVAGHGGNTTVLKGEGVYALLAHGIQSEPGPRSRSFEFDARSQGNTVMSHDNDAMAGITHDNTFAQLTSDGLYAGDFSKTAETFDGVGIDYRLALQIEAKGYVRELSAKSITCIGSNGAPGRNLCSADPAPAPAPPTAPAPAPPTASREAGAPAPVDCSVTAFGALPDDDTVDDTPAFTKALNRCRGGTVTVPVGRYRLDSTVNVGNVTDGPGRNRTCSGEICPWCHCPTPPRTTQLHLNHGAILRRLTAYSDAITPVLRLAQFGSMITGDGGVVESENPSPRGVVNLGPDAMPPLTPHERDIGGEHGAIQFATIRGLRITGQYRCTNKTKPHDGACQPARNFSRSIVPVRSGPQTPPLNKPWTNESDFEQCGMFVGQLASFGRDGSVGLCVDSAEPLDMGQSAVYQNTIKDLLVTGTDVGIYAGKWANANHFSNLQFISNGAASIWFEGVDESQVIGSFTGGEFPGNPWPTGSESFNIKEGDESFRQVLRVTGGGQVRATLI